MHSISEFQPCCNPSSFDSEMKDFISNLLQSINFTLSLRMVHKKKTYKNIQTATSTCCNANMFMWWSGAKPRRNACVQQITVTDIKDVESKKRSKMTPIISGSLGRSAGLWCVLRATRGHCWLWKASGWACPLFPRTARPYQAWTGSQCSSVDSCLFVQVKLRRNVDDRIQ